MHIPRNRYAIAAGLAAAMTVVTFAAGCSDSGNKTTASQTQTTSPPAVIQTSSAAPTPTQAAVPAEPTPASTTAIPAPQFDQFSTKLAYKAGRAPKAERRNGIVSAPAYVQTVMISYRDIWRKAFDSANLDMPRLTYDATYKGDSYVSACYTGGEPIVVKPTMTGMLYCSLDVRPDGAVVFPLESLAKAWSKTSAKQGDLSVAVSMTRQTSLVLTSSLKRQLGLPNVSDQSELYMAACLSGAWGHAVYPQKAFSEKDLAVALEHSFAIPTIGDGPTASLKNDQQAVTAWIVGFRGGNPAECGRQFWK